MWGPAQAANICVANASHHGHWNAASVCDNSDAAPPCLRLRATPASRRSAHLRDHHQVAVHAHVADVRRSPDLPGSTFLILLPAETFPGWQVGPPAVGARRSRQRGNRACRRGSSHGRSEHKCARTLELHSLRWQACWCWLIWLIPRFGASGVGGAWIISMVIQNLLLLGHVRKHLHLSAWRGTQGPMDDSRWFWV